MKEYNFFSYEVFEARHLSEEERENRFSVFWQQKLRAKSQHRQPQSAIDRVEYRVVNYCTRFYERQFITRKHVNSDILSRFENLRNDYLKSDLPQKTRTPFCEILCRLAESFS